ncbi:uncharacterized protein [Prorops nasuta]|uniref:uncharacterized protein n=1 Tax=Prorops nasuta TaxID=863751 RepID=UPI0034CD8AAD
MSSITKSYSIVVFLPRTKGKKDIVDLVPSNWITETEAGSFSCKYPPEDECASLDAYVKELIEANSNWKEFPVEIVGNANSYKQGCRRLKRSFFTKDIRSTDDECRAEQKSTLLSSKNITREFEKVSTMSDHFQSKNSLGNFPLKENINTENLLSLPTTHTSQSCERMNLDSLKVFIDEKFKDLTHHFNKTLDSHKRSLQYDFKNKLEEIKNTIILNNDVTSNSTINLKEVKDNLGVALPLKTLQDFVNFDEMMKDATKKESLLTLYRVTILGCTTVKDAIKRLMMATTSKDVEIHYSGTGKMIRGVGKRNFSQTEVFGCLKDILVEKFGDDPNLKNLAGQVGRWLAGANDREGGRKERNINK